MICSSNMWKALSDRCTLTTCTLFTFYKLQSYNLQLLDKLIPAGSELHLGQLSNFFEISGQFYKGHVTLHVCVLNLHGNVYCRYYILMVVMQPTIVPVHCMKGTPCILIRSCLEGYPLTILSYDHGRLYLNWQWILLNSYTSFVLRSVF